MGDNPPNPPPNPQTPTLERSRNLSTTRFNPYGIGYNTTSSGNVRGSNFRGRSTSSRPNRTSSTEDL